MRTKKEIQKAHEKYNDLVWYSRFLSSTTERPDGAIANAERIEATYSDDDLKMATGYDIGMLNGKLSALRWAMGEKWDYLDT